MPRVVRALRVLAGAAFALQFVALDVVTRDADGGHPWRDLAVRLASALIGSAILLVATTRRRAAIVAVVTAIVFVVQVLVYRYYHAMLDVQVAATAIHAFRDVRPVLVRALPSLALGVAATAAVELALLEAARPLARSRRPAAPLALVLAALAVVGAAGPRHATPEITAAHATTALRAPARGGSTSAVSLPPLLSTRTELPDVLFVLSESIRAADYSASGARPTARAAAAVTAGRVDLTEMRAVSSYTAVSVSALLTGRSQEGSRDEILRAPNLFDVAHATRDAAGSAPVVLYVSAQSETVFEAKDVRASIDRFVTVETILGRDVDDAEYVTVPLDRLVTERLETELAAVDRGAAVFAVLHLAGTHAPYFVDEANAPYAPYSHVVTWSGMPELHRAYEDAIVAQDVVVARAIRAFLAHHPSRPKVVLFTSDHGEAFGEHGAIHHGQNLFDEQIHVPAWVWASPGALSPTEEAALAESRARFVTHLDLLPTLLDVLGLADNTALRDARAELDGRSLLRRVPPDAPPLVVPITNCTGMFPCPLDTWGLLADRRKLVAQRGDGDWQCFALDGPERHAPADDRTCATMRERSRTTYASLPNGRANR